MNTRIYRQVTDCLKAGGLVTLFFDNEAERKTINNVASFKKQYDLQDIRGEITRVGVKYPMTDEAEIWYTYIQNVYDQEMGLVWDEAAVREYARQTLDQMITDCGRHHTTWGISQDMIDWAKK